MSKPIPGQPYTVVKGDTLWDISAAAYGDPRLFSTIWRVNQSNLQSDDPHWIYPGEVLWIPPQADLKNALDSISDDFLPGKGSGEATLVIEGVEIPVQEMTLVKTIESCSNGWSARCYWDANEPDLKALLYPDKIQEAKVYLGGVLMCAGFLYVKTFASGLAGRYVLLEGNNPTADIIDSTTKPPYQRNGMSLREIAEDLVKPFGIPVVYDDSVNAVIDSKFKRVTIDKTQKIFDFLNELAKQRGILISSTDEGALLFTNAKKSPPVGLLEDGKYPIDGDQESRVTLDMRKRFRINKAVGKSPRARKKSAVSIDENIERARFNTTETDDTEQGDIQRAADWARSKQLAESLTINVPVLSWYDPRGVLWRENTMVSYKSTNHYLGEVVDLLVKNVIFRLTPEGGQKSVLTLTPLETYTGEPFSIGWS